MLAMVAAVLFGLALILDLAETALGVITANTLVVAGLLCVALHLAGVGAGRNFSSFRGRRRGRR